MYKADDTFTWSDRRRATRVVKPRGVLPERAINYGRRRTIPQIEIVALYLQFCRKYGQVALHCDEEVFRVVGYDKRGTRREWTLGRAADPVATFIAIQAAKAREHLREGKGGAA